MTNNQEPNSHQSIIKSTGIFGFAQLIKIAIGIVSSKLIAIFLGASGIGFVGLLNNTLTLIASVSGFGINVVAVRDLSLESSQSSLQNFSKRYKIIRNWSIISGVFGFLLTIIFSKLLSKWTFGDTKYYFWFVLLSINFMINALTVAQSALMQSKRMIKSIALTNVFSAFFIVLVTIPIYYFFRFQAIVPVILISSLISFLVNYYFAKKLELMFVNNLTLNELIFEIKPLLKLGFLLSLNVIFGQIGNFLIRLYKYKYTCSI